MSTDLMGLSVGFARLYCEKSLFDSFSGFHPISFGRILPFLAGDRAVDDSTLILAEEAYLIEQNERTRLAVLDAYARCHLLPELEAQNLRPVLDFFDVDFFELMGLIYANAGMFKCALRWQREAIVRLEASRPDMSSDTENVYASVGYGLYSLGLFEEAISWSKSCIGSRAISEAMVRSLISYESGLEAGSIRAVERSGPRTRFTAASVDPSRVGSFATVGFDNQGLCTVPGDLR